MRSKTPEKACKWTLCRDVSSAAVSKIKNYQAQICICCEPNRNMNYWYDINFGNWSDQTKQQRTTQKEEECMVKYANNAICAQKQKMTDYKILR